MKLFVMFVVLIFAGCATRPHVKIPDPEKPFFTQEGMASWYGPGFHGRKTSSGERYDQNHLTCAHKTLPFGTILRITNLKNGQTVHVRVTDRGPFIPRRVVDLSRLAAEQIDLIQPGSALVRLEAIGKQTYRRD